MAQTNPLSPAPAARRAAGGPAFVQSRDGTRIAYGRVGNGPNLVLVGGALSTKDISFMRAFVKALAQNFAVVNYDRRGRGGSGDTPPFSVQKEVEDIQALVDAVGPSHVFGMSSGAALALEAAAGGVPMLSVTAFEPPYMVGDHRKPAHTEYEARLKALVAEGRRDDALKLFMRTVGVPGFMLAIMRLLPMWKELRPVAHTLPYDAAVMSGFEPPVARLATIRVPTLAVYGGKTPQALKDGTRFVAERIPGAELRSLPRQSHNLKPAAILPTLVEFTGKHTSLVARDANGSPHARKAPAVARTA